jgi:hypothetical protein
MRIDDIRAIARAGLPLNITGGEGSTPNAMVIK